jgi:hypothetical protein
MTKGEKAPQTELVRGSSYDGNMRLTGGDEQPSQGMAASNLAIKFGVRRAAPGVPRPIRHTESAVRSERNRFNL